MDAAKSADPGVPATPGGTPVPHFRTTAPEQERIRELFRLIPRSAGSALDVGARDGYLSLRLTEQFDHVTALDLETPRIAHPAVTCVRGNAANLEFRDRSFDLVLCAEVLEHIPPHLLRSVCAELARVTRGHLLIGVPYDQDTRLGRTTCRSCGKRNPPYGHVNTFNELNLSSLFPTLKAEKIAFVGKSQERTNWLSTKLNDWAGNPYGTYAQEESCVYCGLKLEAPTKQTLWTRGCAAAAHHLRVLQNRFRSRQANWIHILYSQSQG